MKINKLIKEIESCDDIISAVQCEREELIEKLKGKLARVGLGVVELDSGEGSIGDKEGERVDWRELQPGDVVAFENTDTDGDFVNVTKGHEYTIKDIEEHWYAGNFPICITRDDNGRGGWVDIEQAGRVKLINRP